MKLIAETAWHHDGDFEFFKNLVIEIVKKTKTDFIKFHLTLDVDEYMHKDHSAYQWAKERVFSKKEWDEVFRITTENGKKLMLLFNDIESIDFGMQYSPDLVEIHSVCLSDINLLNHLKAKIKDKTTEIVLGVGGTDLYEVENAINIINNENITLMHGFQNYPTKYTDINFNKIRKIMDMYPLFKHGYADHTAWDNEYNVMITIIGASIGMDYIEKHVTTDVGEGRVDWQAAVSFEKFNEIENKLEILELTKGDGLLKMNEGEKSYSIYGSMKKCSILKKSVKKGDKFKLSDISFKRTSQNSDLSLLNIQSRLGHTFSKDLKEGAAINSKDLN